MSVETRVCPTCQSSERSYSIASSPPAEALSFEDIKNHWSGFFKKKIFFSYSRCTCGLLYCPTFFNNETLNQLYARMSDNTAGVALAPLKKTQASYFKLLKKYSPLSGNYLEFGPDIGLFTENCFKEGSYSSYWLFEPNQEVWSALREKIGNKIHLFSSLEALNSIPDNSISTLVMIHVLDHLTEPTSLLKEIKQKLKPGAILLFVTHDEQSLLAKLTRASWPPYCLQHPQLFNKRSITRFLTGLDFQVLTSEKSWNYFPITYLLKHALYLLGIRLNLPELNHLYLPLKLGNIITLARNT